MTNSNSNDDACTPAENPAVADIRAKWAQDPSAAKTRRECMAVGGWRMTTQLTKEKSGVLRAYVDGGSVRITTDSLYRHLIDLASVPLHKVRKPVAGFRRKRRTPTVQELDALQRANERRRIEAEERRRAHQRRRSRPLRKITFCRGWPGRGSRAL
jgi:hypothetical protein